MGLFGKKKKQKAMSYLMNESMNKSMAMSKIIQIMIDETNDYEFSSVNEAAKFYTKMNIEKKEAFEYLYKCMQNMPPLAEILNTYHSTPEELEEISKQIALIGFNYFNEGDYIPVALVSFKNPLDYILSKRDLFLDSNTSRENKKEIIDTAIELLY